MKVKNWNKFQHFKDRRPPWIKLYRDIIDDLEWFELSGDASKALVMLWLIASENNGELPDIKTISFRLRLDIHRCKELLSELTHYIDIDVISDRYQNVMTETETETETETDKKLRKRVEYPEQFNQLWLLYGMRGVKKTALVQWKKLDESQKDAAVEALNPYFQEKPEVEYRVYFERYLSGHVFEGVLERKAAGCLNIPKNTNGKTYGQTGEQEYGL
jgi:hypothetical protein